MDGILVKKPKKYEFIIQTLFNRQLRAITKIYFSMPIASI